MRPVIRAVPRVAALRVGDPDRREGVGVALFAVFDQHRLAAADQAVEPARSGAAAAASRRRAARALIISCSSCGMRAAGVFGPRREGEDMGGDDVAIVEQLQASSAPPPRSRSGSRR